MRVIMSRHLLVCACFILTNCGATKAPEKAKEEEKKLAKVLSAPRLVGRIASMPADRRFVLIQSYGKWTVVSGSILTTRGPNDRTANLLATGESLGEFAAADVQSGTVELGDGVYSRHIPKPASVTDGAQIPEPQEIALPEELPKNN